VDAEQLADWRRKVQVSIQRIEKGMLGEWMMGEQFTLGDVSCFAMLINMPVRYAESSTRRIPQGDRLVQPHAGARLGEAGAGDRHPGSKFVAKAS
jgi:hypothetical protein